MSRADRPAAPPVVQPLIAGTRDASWYDRPDVHTVKAWHIATEHDTAACSPGPEFHRSIILFDSYLDADQVFDDLRCRRPGCRVHWAKVPSRPR